MAPATTPSWPTSCTAAAGRCSSDRLAHENEIMGEWAFVGRA